MITKLTDFIKTYNISLLTCYRPSGIHIVTCPYPYYIPSNSSPYILPFDKSISVEGDIFRVNYIPTCTTPTNIPWTELNLIITELILQQFDILSNYNKHYQTEYRYINSENNSDLLEKIAELSQHTYEFMYIHYKNTKYNYELVKLEDFINKIKLNSITVNYSCETNFIIYTNFHLIYKLLDDLTIISCKISIDKNNIIFNLKFNNIITRKCKDLKDKIILSYIVEIHNGELTQDSDLISNLTIKIPIIPTLFTSTNFKNKLKGKKILFVSNNIQIDKYLLNLFNSFDINIRITSYNTLLENSEDIKKNSNHDGSLGNVNVTNRKPHIVMFIITDSSQINMLDQCKKKLEDYWCNIQCVFMTVNIHIPNHKHIVLPISSDEFINLVDPPSPTLFKMFKNKKKIQSVLSFKRNHKAIILVDNNINTINLKLSMEQFIRIPIYIVNDFTSCWTTIKYLQGNVYVIFDEDNSHQLISEIYNSIEESNYNTTLAIVLSSKANLENYILINLRYHLLRPFDDDSVKAFIKDLHIIS
jgi:hypothetical protein